MWVLGTEPRSYGRAARALNNWAISPAPHLFINPDCGLFSISVIMSSLTIFRILHPKHYPFLLWNMKAYFLSILTGSVADERIDLTGDRLTGKALFKLHGYTLWGVLQNCGPQGSDQTLRLIHDPAL